MNFGELLVHLGHVLGILSGDDPTMSTALTTINGSSTPTLTTPLIFDTTTLERLSSEHSTQVSTKFLSTLVSERSDPTEKVLRGFEDKNVTGITAKSEVPITSTEAPGTSTNGTGTGGTGTGTGGTGSVTGSTGSVTEHTGSTGSVTEHTGSTGTETEHTGSTGTETKHTGSTGTETEHTGSTGTETEHTGSTGTETEAPSTTNTGTDPTTPSQGTTIPAPTEKPKLSRGAVAGIVIGCLLLVAVVTAALVFFFKNRASGPEVQRLRV